jgi:hypothetical protein
MNDEDAGVQRAAADSLAAVGRGNEDVGNKLADIAISALDPLKRAAALEALSNGWPEHAKLESAIAWALKTPAPDLRLAAIAARVRRRAQNDSDLEELLSMASDRGFNVNYGWSNEVTATLAAGWPASGRLKQACLEGAQKYFIHGTGVDKDVAWRVLLLAFPQDSDVAKLCVAEIRSQQYPFLGLDFEAWQILAKNFRDHPEVVAAIDEWAPSQEYHDPEVALAAMTGRTPTLKQKLITSLKTSSIPHWPAGSLLEGWGMGDSDVARELLAVANGPADRASSVAHLVPQILNDPVQSRARLLDHLEDPDSKRRDFVMTGLAQLGQGQDDGEIVSRCMKVLPAVKDFDRFGFETQLILGFAKSAQVRKFAVTALGQREAPIAAIASAYSSDEEMRSMVIECVRPLPQALRAQIVSHLNNSPSDGGFALSILEDYDTESDAELKVLSSIGFHRRLAGSPIDTTEAVQKLSKVICAYGPDHEERRCAAFTGLTILKRLDLMTDSLETIGDPDPVSINIHHRGQVNVSLVRFIAEHWVELRTIFGPKLAPRLAGRFGSIAQFWEGLCIVGFDFPEMHQELFDALQADQELAVQPSALHFLARTQPRSSLLLERCLSALSRSDATWGDVDRLRNATAVFTDNFGGDPDIVKTLLSRIPPDLRRSGLVLALCCGWPDNPVIDELNYQLQHRNRPTVGQSVYLALTYARIPSDRLPKQLEDHLNRIPLRNLYVSRALADAVLWRLKHDPTAARSLLSSLSRDTYPSGKCTIPALLAKTQGVSPELARWSEEEVTYQLQVLESPQLGFDLARGHISSVVLSLFDLQDSTSAREL